MTLFILLALVSLGVREVRATSCDIVRINLALGMTTQLMFETAPTMTLHADEEHFKIRSSADAKRSIAIVPFVDQATIAQLTGQHVNGLSLSPALFAKKLDEALRTNLFVFFKNGSQFMFEMRFVEKSKADYIVSVRQSFTKDCLL